MGTKINTRLIVRMIFETIPDVTVFVHVMKVVVSLKQTMMFDYPKITLTDVRTQNGGGDLAVIVRSQNIADVMQQSADNSFFIGSGPFGPCGRLQ